MNMKLSCFVHAPIGEDIIEFEFEGEPTQTELYQHIHAVIEKHGLDSSAVVFLNRIIDIHSRVLDFNKIPLVGDRPFKVVYTIRSFQHLPLDVKYHSYYVPRSVVAQMESKVIELLDIFDFIACSKDPEINKYGMSLPYTRKLNIIM